MRAAVVGSVGTTATTVQALVDSQVKLVGVAGYEPADPARVSGYYNLRRLAGELEVDYIGFRSVNDPRVVRQLYIWNIDFLFVVGVSQLVRTNVLQTARRGCIGYHPTALPRGRGRAPVAWLTLGVAPGASTLFQLVPEADAGGILEQVPFDVDLGMDASDVAEMCNSTLKIGLDRLLPRLARGEWEPVAQSEAQATFLGKRDQFDGLVDWLRPASEVDGVIRAAAPPHPGAYCYAGNRRLRILKSEGVIDDSPYRGVPGKVLRHDGDSFEIQCKPGVVRIRCVFDENGEPVELRDGTLLRVRVDDELYDLRTRVANLERTLRDLSARVGGTESFVDKD